MTKELAIQILRGEVLGTNEQTHEAVFMAIKALKNEQKHGRWVDVMTEEWCTFDECKCSVCGVVEYFNKGWKKFSYCPNCGAKMFAKDIDVPNKEGAKNEL